MRMEMMKTMLGALLLATLMQANALAQGAGAQASIIKVIISPGSIVLSQTTAKPGPARILVENRTLMANPAIKLTGTVGAAAVSAVGRLPVLPRAGQRKTWHDAVLVPGTYTISLEAAPQVKATLVVSAN